MTKTGATDTEWQGRVQSWQQSGLSQSTWCQQNDISVSKSGDWKRKLETVSAVKSAHHPAFVPVTPAPLPAEPGASSQLTVILPNGVAVSGINEGNLSLVKQLVRGML